MPCGVRENQTWMRVVERIMYNAHIQAACACIVLECLLLGLAAVMVCINHSGSCCWHVGWFACACQPVVHQLFGRRSGLIGWTMYQTAMCLFQCSTHRSGLIVVLSVCAAFVSLCAVLALASGCMQSRLHTLLALHPYKLLVGCCTGDMGLFGSKARGLCVCLAATAYICFKGCNIALHLCDSQHDAVFLACGVLQHTC